MVVGNPDILRSFARPLTVSIRPPQLPSNPSNVLIHYFNEGEARWIPMPTTYHANSGVFETTTTHFTLFALIETEEEAEEELVVQPSPNLSSFTDGDLIRQEGTQDVYLIKIAGGEYYKRLILNPAIFDSYGHLFWNNIKSVSEDQLNAFSTSTLVIEVNPDGTPTTNKVYTLTAEANADSGIKRWLNMSAERFLQLGHRFSSLFTINHTEASPTFYAEGEEVR